MKQVADTLRSYGRGDDTMLIHMTPGEVAGLQHLAMAHGGSLSVNPHTGLPEAGFLGKILPVALGALASFLLPGISPFIMPAIIGAGTGIAKGDLGAGLMAGLSAFGGGALGGAIQGIGTTAATTAASTAATAAPAATPAFAGALAPGVNMAAFNAAMPAFPGALAGGVNTAALGAAIPTAQLPASGGAGLFGKFGSDFAASAAIPGVPGIATTGLAALGAAQPLLYQEKYKAPKGKEPPPYAGPYRLAPRAVSFPGADRDPNDSSEFQYFDPSNPVTLDASGQTARTYAKGGETLQDGAFIMDARTVSELGNGSSDAGKELLARYGGKGIDGPGDGVSDSIRASVGGRTGARVARDEVKFGPKAVKKIGDGDSKRGADKLYKLMAQAHRARKAAGRGADTNVRKGLASL